MEHSAFAKGHSLNPGNYNHFEVDGAKSKLTVYGILKVELGTLSITKHILSKRFVASHELTFSLEIRTSPNINYIFGIFVRGELSALRVSLLQSLGFIF